MIFISHRKNSIEELSKTNKKYGIEIDLRSRGDSIIIHHDPMVQGEDFSRWLKHYNHKFLILNVKEEGLETYIIEYLKNMKLIIFFS